MVETFTPAGCGGRTRRVIALAFFAVAAIGAAAALGALLGAAGAALPGRWALGAAVALGLAGVLREAGVLRFRIPESRRQVPEPLRRTTPLPVWTSAYGAILGSGVGTFQPVITFWVACAGALATGRPGVAALCLAPFGAARVLMIALPGGDPVRRLAGAHRFVRPANALALAAFAALLVPGVASGAPPAGQSDPSVSGDVIAYTDQANGVHNVVVSAAGAPPVAFADARLPAIDGDTLAYVDAAGIRVVLWGTGQEILRIGGQVDKPAVGGGRLAYVEAVGARHRLVLHDLATPQTLVITRVGPGVDLGRPALSGQLIAWHEAGGDLNRIQIRNLRTRRTTSVVSGGRRGLHVNPSLAAGHIIWVDSFGERSTVHLRKLPHGRIRTVAVTFGPRFHFWNTALQPGVVYVTRWALNTARAQILRYRWRS